MCAWCLLGYMARQVAGSSVEQLSLSPYVCMWRERARRKERERDRVCNSSEKERKKCIFEEGKMSIIWWYSGRVSSIMINKNIMEHAPMTTSWPCRGIVVAISPGWSVGLLWRIFVMWVHAHLVERADENYSSGKGNRSPDCCGAVLMVPGNSCRLLRSSSILTA